MLCLFKMIPFGYRVKKKYIDFTVGKRDINTGQKLWNNIEKKEIGNVFSDHYKAYESILKEENHIQSKEEAYTVEGYNSILRHFLARLGRRTKCYSKCDKMLEYSMRLLMAKRNGELAIFN